MQPRPIRGGEKITQYADERIMRKKKPVEIQGKKRVRIRINHKMPEAAVFKPKIIQHKVQRKNSRYQENFFFLLKEHLLTRASLLIWMKAFNALINSSTDLRLRKNFIMNFGLK